MAPLDFLTDPAPNYRLLDQTASEPGKNTLGNWGELKDSIAE